MTTGPTDAKVTTAAGGPDGMPLALKLNEGLGFTGRDVRGVWSLALVWLVVRAQYDL